MKIANNTPLTDEQSAMVESCYPMICMMARRCRYLDYDDALDSNVEAVIRSARIFDPAKGVKFSAFAYNALKRFPARVPGKRMRPLFPLLCDPELQSQEPDEKLSNVADQVAKLDDRERFVVDQRLRGMSLRQVGRMVGLTAERIRQIERRAHRRLATMLEAA